MIDKKEYRAKDILSFDEEAGTVEAVFSVFNEVDSDGDVVLPKSIRSGYGDKGVAMVWGHDWKNIIGKGKIIQDDDKAVFKGSFNLNTNAGKEAYETVKAMSDLQQWSFGFEVLDSEVGMFQKDGAEEKEVRYLKDLKVWEVSPVMVGANQNTGTVMLKNLEENDDEVLEQNEAGVETLDNENKTITENVGQRFTDEVDSLLIKMTALLKRAKELTALRLGKEKTLSSESTEALESLKDALQDMHQDIDTLLSIGSDNEVLENELDANELFRETTQLLAETLDL
ncbi:MAG: putative prohead protease [Prokaryotic dsDNA virus sp.]|nr:MAG: putative prohead protease [Prokaryotic dsDNA virus sp.]